jgi:hypothetical protein
LPKATLVLRNAENRNLPGETFEFEHVGAIMGGGNNALLTFFNEDPTDEEAGTGPKPFLAIATDLVYKVETPEFNRAPVAPTPKVNLVVPSHLRRPN